MIGQVLDGKYRVLEPLGKGGMGEVYLVEHIHLGRREALKVLHTALATEPHFVSRFRREARATNRLNHPNIVAIHDFGRLAAPDGRFYLAMEFIPGDNLAALLREDGRLEVERALALLSQLTSAVEHAHARGVVHRDLKPDNMVIVERRDREVLKVLDFGIAKIVAPDYRESMSLTPAGAVFGTSEFMAPEQLEGVANDPRSDLYAIGCIAYEMLTGVVPFRGTNVEVMHAHLNEPPIPPSLRRPEAGIPRDLDNVVLRCLEKKPAARYQSAHELAAALRSVGAAPPAPPREGGGTQYDDEETLERRFVATAAPEEGRPTKLRSREDVRHALQDGVRQLAELLVDSGQNAPQLVIGLARAHELADELSTNERETAAVETQHDQVSQRTRERENALRFALGELQFDQSHSPAAAASLTPIMERQIAAFETRLRALAAESQQESDKLTERTIELVAARANLEERREAVYASLEPLVLELVARGALTPTSHGLVDQIAALRNLLT